jgi:hypothetical protein
MLKPMAENESTSNKRLNFPLKRFVWNIITTPSFRVRLLEDERPCFINPTPHTLAASACMTTQNYGNYRQAAKILNQDANYKIALKAMPCHKNTRAISAIWSNGTGDAGALMRRDALSI